MLTVALRSIELDQARARVDLVAADIVRFGSRAGGLVTIGESLPVVQELIQPGNLDHWASPTTYIEIDNLDGYVLGKSSNMGSAVFARTPNLTKPAPANYQVEQTPLGQMLVRNQLIVFSDRTPVIVKVGEKLDLFYATLDRMRELLLYVVLIATLAVLSGSFFIASGAIKPIDRLAAAMREIRSSQELNRRLSWPSRSDEIGRLCSEFNAMLARLEEAFARERQFISDASHELKTPLTVIHANAQMLERWADKDPSVRAESLAAIRDESAALSHVVDGMLTLAKAESGDALRREPLALDTVVAEAVRSAAARAQAKGLELTFIAELPKGQPVVYGEPQLLRRLVSNLVDNAIKFTERGGVEVRLAHRDGYAVVEVSDTGVGIDEASMARIFDRFYRTDKSRSRQVEGTGLGLAIARSIARVHDGTIDARPNAQGGTCFLISLPLAHEPEQTTVPPS
ncbi:MAG TPA: HAMP domain-containing sensor histidine kinase [Candidatus Acidoferrales bacterium]|nr:HAMP domain-containing sensor histidine kinase [Candidatus Acidoferrales bacterium]